MRFIPIFLAEFIFSLHFAATLYINSSFLEQFFSLDVIGALYAAGAIFSLFFFFTAPRLLNKLGNKRFLLLYITLTLAATVGAAYAWGPIDAAFFFLLYACVSVMVFYALDILVEEITVNRKTGHIRGLYLTVLNVAIMLGPILITLIPTDNKFKVFYLAAAAILLPIYILSIFGLNSRHKRKVYVPHSLPFKLWWKAKSIRRVTFARLILEFFYSVMTIYVPIYLHTFIGFEWKEIGFIFAIMLLPFILFEWPMGALADREHSERDIMTMGLLIMAASLIMMPYIGHELSKWAIALFISRLGAAFVEMTTESYFFKSVDSSDTGLISIFRLDRSAGLVLGAITGAAALHFWPFQSVFFILALACLFGQRFARKLYVR